MFLFAGCVSVSKNGIEGEEGGERMVRNGEIKEIE